MNAGSHAQATTGSVGTLAASAGAASGRFGASPGRGHLAGGNALSAPLPQPAMSSSGDRSVDETLAFVAIGHYARIYAFPRSRRPSGRLHRSMLADAGACRAERRALGL